MRLWLAILRGSFRQWGMNDFFGKAQMKETNMLTTCTHVSIFVSLYYVKLLAITSKFEILRFVQPSNSLLSALSN